MEDFTIYCDPKETKFYDVLQVQSDATDETINKSYKYLSLMNHPDKHPAEFQEACTQKVINFSSVLFPNY